MNGQFITDSPQCKGTITTPQWPSVSEFILWVGLGVTVFCSTLSHLGSLLRRLNSTFLVF